MSSITLSISSREGQGRISTRPYPLRRVRKGVMHNHTSITAITTTTLTTIRSRNPEQFSHTILHFLASTKYL